jgi:metal-dependent amidase/aminoacylase/carboxypeptidase family protein
MTVLSGLASHLAGSRPARGAAILLFQPAEETGQGARRVLDDPRWSAVKVDMAFALHNLPGYPMGAIILREGVFASSSRGMIVKLVGATSHAAEPQNGCSPALAVAQIIEAISASAQFYTALEEAAQATIIHARVGQRAFGTSPGEGVVMATLRAHDDCVMQTLVESCTRSVRSIAAAHGLQVEVSWTEEFPVTENHPRCVEVVRRRARDLGLEVVAPPWPFAWSEDFGWFSGSSPIALVGLGAGEKTPALHNPDYDFPDELIAGAVRLLESIVDDVTG